MKTTINHAYHFDGLTSKISSLPHLDLDSIGRSIGSNIASLGTALNLPEMNVSERFGVTGDQGQYLVADKYNPIAYPAYQTPQVTQQVKNALPNINSSGPAKQTTTQATNPNTGRAFQPGENGYVSPVNTDMSEINRQIDEVYGSSEGYLNQAEQNLRNDLPTILDQLNTNYDLNQKGLVQSKDSTMAGLDQQLSQADSRKNDVLADARRLYSELQRGYNQRFGGASSAGQAATELGNLEQQRQMGKTNAGFTDFANQVAFKRTEIDKDFGLQSEKLAASKTQAISDANRDFQNKLLSIMQSKAENASAKASAKLAALQDLRNKVFQIDLQNQQFQQTLAANRAAASSALDNYVSNASNQLSQSQQNLTSTLGSSAFQTPTSNLKTTSISNGTANPYLGQIGKKKEDDGFLSLLG